MFGRQNDNKQDDGAAIPDQTIDGALGNEPAAETPVETTPAVDNTYTWQHPGSPLDSDLPNEDDPQSPITLPSDPMIVNGDSNPVTTFPNAPSTPMPSRDSSSTSASDSPVVSDPIHNDELVDIKRDALNKLSPLIGQLEQSPEERFKTTMMMIQASDDQTKIKDAYDAAQAIEDEKARAQALLDVINEINYFTQQGK